MSSGDNLLQALSQLVRDPEGPRGWLVFSAILSLTAALACAWLAVHCCGDPSSRWLDFTAFPVLLGLGGVAAAFPALRARETRWLALFWAGLAAIGASAPWIAASRALCWGSAA